MKNNDHQAKTSREGVMIDLTEVRGRLGSMWGLNRPITRVEFARALRLSGKSGGEYMGKLEKNKTLITGPMIVAISAFLSGFKPDNMDDLITPGYPRGPLV